MYNSDKNFSAKTTGGILQDVHACILGANLNQILIQEAENELEINPKTKHPYQINRNVAFGILKNQLPYLLTHPEHLIEKIQRLKRKIKKHKVAVIPKRACKRKRGKNSYRKFHFSKKRAF